MRHLRHRQLLLIERDPQLLQVALAHVRQQQVLRVRDPHQPEAEAPGELAGFRLGEFAERKAQEIDLLAGGGEQKIALVALLVAGPVERAAAAGQRPLVRSRCSHAPCR